MSARLIPPRSELTQPFWDAAGEGALALQFCGTCDTGIFPPRAHCPDCGGSNLQWRSVSGEGSVYTYTVAHRAAHPVFASQCPLVIAVIVLAEGPRMISNVVGVDPEDVYVDMPVRVTFEAIDDTDLWLPLFTPAA